MSRRRGLLGVVLLAGAAPAPARQPAWRSTVTGMVLSEGRANGIRFERLTNP